VIGTGAYYVGFSLPVGLLSAGFCSMAGMLPDIDSSSSRSFQECIYFAAGLCAVMIVERMRFFGFDHNVIMLGGAIAFLFVRFAVGELVKKLTVHRGMFHSVPAAILAGELTFCLSSGDFGERVVKSFAIIAGYLSHLILDEVCSIDHVGKKIKLKQSFGTALKFYDPKHIFATMTLYILVLFIGVGTMRNPDFIATNEHNNSEQSDNSQTTDKNSKTTIRNLIRYLAGFDGNNYEESQHNNKRFPRRRHFESKNRFKDNAQSQTAQHAEKTATNSSLPKLSIPAGLMTMPENLVNQNSDIQIYSQYRKRNFQKLTSTNSPPQKQSEIIQPDMAVFIPSESEVVVPLEDYGIPVVDDIDDDNEMAPLGVINRNIPIRPKSISPNRLPAPINR
jgi:membrane-bound metal-dependent hydrolase YbcI (DUF457 family)